MWPDSLPIRKASRTQIWSFFDRLIHVASHVEGCSSHGRNNEVFAMVNFMWLDQAKVCPDSWWTLFLGVYVRVFSKEINLWIGRLCKEDIPLPMWWSNLIHWGPKYNKKVEEWQTLFSFVLGHPFLLPLEIRALVLGPLQIETYTSTCLCSQAFGLRLKYSTGFSGSEAYRWHRVAHFSLHDCISQLL